VHPRAGQAGHAFISVARCIVLVVLDPMLDVKRCIGTFENEMGHAL
jgi:hypothetical protein